MEQKTNLGLIFKAIGSGVLILLGGCEDPPDMATVSYPSYGYPGPSNEAATIYNQLDNISCTTPGKEDAQKFCVDDVGSFDAKGCGYNQVVEYCTPAWADANNAAKMKAKIRGCQMAFQTKASTYFFDQGDLDQAGIRGYCTEETDAAYIYHTWRFSATGEGDANAPAKGYPYQGTYLNQKKQVRIVIANWSKNELSKDFKSEVQGDVARILANFGYEVWNFLSSKGELYSFPVDNVFSIAYDKKSDGSEGSTFRYLCADPLERQPSESKCSMDPGSGVAGKYWLGKSGFMFNGQEGTGVSSEFIDVRVIIVDNKYGAYSNNLYIDIGSGGLVGEINTSPDPMGLVVWCYASGGKVNRTTVSHEIGHALLQYHEDLVAAQHYNLSDPNGLMIPGYPNTRTSDYPSIRPFMADRNKFNIKDLPGGVSLFVDHLILWPTAEGRNSVGGGDMELQKNNGGEQ